MGCNEFYCYKCKHDVGIGHIHKDEIKSFWNYQESKPILDPDLLSEQMLSITKAMEDNISAQKLCGECLKPRPENIETLLKEGWNIVQKPMTSTMDNNTMQLVFHIEQWWLCKKCQENL